MDNNIYFDNNATTQIHPEVFEAMLPYINGKFFGNSSSLHSYGRKAKEAIELARFQIATAINCQPNDIIFTSGGSEADNQALLTAAMIGKKKGKKIKGGNPFAQEGPRRKKSTKGSGPRIGKQRPDKVKKRNRR